MARRAICNIRNLLGKWAEGGVMDPSVYLALVTIHGTIMVFFVLTAGLSGTFSNLLIPLQIGARDMASGFLNMVSYWLFFLSSLIMIMSLFVEAGPASAGWTIYPPLSALPQAIPGSGAGYDAVACLYGNFYCIFFAWVFKLCGNGYKLKNKRNAYDASSSYYMGVFCNSYYWYCIFPCTFICSAYAYYG
jgi:heme/copper-type cytochrome/quinol oxidase subunit 1